MIRMHLDDIRQSMEADAKQGGRGHFVYLARWLEANRAIIVQPSDITVSNNFMPGNFTTEHGRWGVTEPYPPYGAYRQLYEDALANGPPRPATDPDDKTTAMP